MVLITPSSVGSMMRNAENVMAARQALFRRAPKRPVLEKLLEAARASKISDEELAEQRISFAYGNAPENSGITKDSVRLAAKRSRVLTD